MVLHGIPPYAALLALTITSASAAGMAPDDPSVASSLVLWLTDAATTYDVATGVWRDSSGNSNDVTNVGLNLNTGISYIAPTLNTSAVTADGNTSALRFGAPLEMMRATNLNEGVGFSEITLVSVYEMIALSGVGNADQLVDRTRPIGIGSSAFEVGNDLPRVFHDNLQQGTHPSIKFDNGNVPNSAYSNTPEPLPSGPFIRVTRLSTGGVFDEWISTNAMPTRVLDSVVGVRNAGSGGGNFGATRVDELFLGDLRRTDNTSTFVISQIVIYKTALADEQIVGIHEWIFLKATGGGTVLVIR